MVAICHFITCLPQIKWFGHLAMCTCVLFGLFEDLAFFETAKGQIWAFYLFVCEEKEYSPKNW